MNDPWDDLYAAIERGDVDALRRAIESGADVHRPDAQGQLPLDAAVQMGRCDMVRVLLDAGADPNRPQPGGVFDGVTPIFWACHKGDVDMVRVLLDHGARVDLWYGDGDTPLHHAVESGNPDVVALLLRQPGAASTLGSFDYISRTPLGVAAWNGHLELARILLEAGSNANAADDERAGDPALRHAVRDGNVDMVKLLLAHGADPRVPGWMMATALHDAEERNTPDLLALLREAGRRLEAGDGDGRPESV